MVIAISPLAGNPWSTMFHEIAHCLMHNGDFQDSQVIERNIMEAEAEAVSLLCLAALELPGIEGCQAYIQHWIGMGQEAEQTLNKSMQRVFQTAHRILRAGMDLPEEQEEQA